MRFMVEPMITVLIFWTLDRTLSRWIARGESGRAESQT
jgi:hypothetical protein